MAHEQEHEVIEGARLDEALASLPGWKRCDKMIEKSWQFGSFAEAMAFANHVAGIAERLNHHPDILISFKQVTLRATTHKAGTTTRADLTLAAQIEG